MLWYLVIIQLFIFSKLNLCSLCQIEEYYPFSRLSQTFLGSGKRVLLASTHIICPHTDQVSYLWKAEVAEEKEDHPHRLCDLCYRNSCLGTNCILGNRQLPTDIPPSANLCYKKHGGYHICPVSAFHDSVLCGYSTDFGTLLRSVQCKSFQ